MTARILDLIDFEKVDTLLEGFNQSTGFVTAILDLEGNVLSKSGWRQICTQFHRIHPETAKKCTISDTVLAGESGKGEKYHFYKCLNGLIDIAVPIVIKGEHIANLFSGQFFFEKPDPSFFQKQAAKYGFNQEIYLKALDDVPIIPEEKVKTIMEFLLNMTQLISDMTFQKLEQIELNDIIHKREKILKLFVENAPASIAMFDKHMHYLVASRRFLADYNLGDQDLIGLSHYEVFPEISEQWKEIHKHCLSGATERCEEDLFPRANGKIDWVRWEIHPWYESNEEIGGIILFSEVITERKMVTETLQNAKTDLEQAQGIAHIGSWKWNIQTGLVEWSDEMYKIFGVDKTNIHVSLHQIIAEAIHPEDRQKVKDNQIAIMNGGASIPIEYRVIRADGEEHYIWADGGKP